MMGTLNQADHVHTGHGKGNNELENIQYHPLSGQASQQALHKGQLEKHNNAITRRHTYNGTGTLGNDIFETAPHFPPLT